ncbi:tripartite tricarboxylate transporter TctB family protein [Serinibacter arcticus]|uniref:Tripartite tricarboxylate transporter TctB family protein n=1 Tax=Serinibacter arcticus TaxID=1655435 RepID=A0A2U1ZY23_9MICO|nr:tripartite tricarboxylate transporter TctB family protein [Serinibacter arcticus]PWD51864.1 tripartite tricarboxylate transporter TctB family protein [Serinibacter arcticus]
MIERRALGALIIPVVLLAVGITLVTGILTMDEAGDGGLFGPKAFPWLIAALCLVVATLMTVQVLLPSTPPPTADPGDEADEILDGDPDLPEGTNWRGVAIVVGGILLFILLLQPVGWLISATLLFAVVAVGMGARNHLVSLGAGLGLAAAIQLVFGGLLGIHIPPGILG